MTSLPSGPVPVRPDLQHITPYGAPQLDVPIRLNTNETPYAPPAEFMAAVAKRVEQSSLHRYPDRDAVQLRTLLGEAYGLAYERVWAANGSNEVLTQLFQAYGGPGRSLLLFNPGYSAHPLLATVAGTPVVTAELDENFGLTPEIAVAAVQHHTPDIVCVASPNNPTGIPVPTESIRALHDNCTGLVILDEAYVELSDNPNEHVALLDELDRLVIVRTFSKAWRMAGIRLGYMLAHEWVTNDILKVRLPYHLDAFTQIVGTTTLEMAEVVTAHVEELIEQRGVLYEGLKGLAGRGVETYPSAGNFLLFRVQDPAHVFNGLLEQGILIRDFSTKPRLEGCLRVSVGTAEENQKFLSALTTLLPA